MLTLTLPEIFGIQPKTSSIIYLPFSLLQPDGTIQVSHQTLNLNFLLKLSLSISTWRYRAFSSHTSPSVFTVPDDNILNNYPMPIVSNSCNVSWKFMFLGRLLSAGWLYAQYKSCLLVLLIHVLVLIWAYCTLVICKNNGLCNCQVSDVNGKVIYLFLSYSCVDQGNEQVGVGLFGVEWAGIVFVCTRCIMWY